MKIKKVISALLVGLMLIPANNISIDAATNYPITSITSAEARTFFLTSDGHVLVSGSNKYGISGLGNTALYSDVVTQIPYLASVKNIAAGTNESYFVLNNGEVYTTGVGIEYSTTVVKVRDISDVKKVAVNGDSVMFLKNNGELYVYGNNKYGQLGAGSAERIYQITKLSGVAGVKDIDMGDNFTVILFDDGTVKVTGYDANGRLGLGNTASQTITTLTSLVNNSNIISKISAGKSHILYVSNSGGLYGTADSGVAIGTANTNRVNVITKLSSFTSPIRKIDTDAGSFVLLEDGSVWSCGYNSYGADFSKTTSDNTSIFKMVDSSVMDMSTGGDHAFLMKSDTNIFSAGKNSNGELGIGTIGNNVVNPTVSKFIYNFYGNKTTTITNSVIKNGVLTFKYAVSVNNSVMLDGSSKIQGDVSSNNGNVTADWSTKITGNIYMGTKGVYTSPDGAALGGNTFILNPTYIFDMPEFKQPPINLNNKGVLNVDWQNTGMTIAEDGYYDSIILNSGYSINIDVGTGTRILHVKNFNLNQGFVNIKGTGKLYLYIDNPFYLKGSSTFNAANVNNSNINVIVANAGTISLSGSTIFKGQLFATSANLSIGNGSSMIGNAVIGGTIVSMSGSTPLTGVLYAPRSDVSLTGSSLIKGALIANSYSGIGSTQVVFAPGSINLPVETVVTPEPEPSTDPVIVPDSTNPGTTLPPEIIDKLKDVDLVINVAKDGDKKLGASLSAYKVMLAHVDSTDDNNSLKRVTNLVEIFGDTFKYHFQYGTYNFYQE